LDAALARVRVHPETFSRAWQDGKTYTATIDESVLAMTVRLVLYNQDHRGDVFQMLKEASSGSFERLQIPVLITSFVLGSILSVGGNLSVVCPESLDGVTMAEAKKASAKTFLGTYRVGPILEACSFWPKGDVPAWMKKPLASDAPVLILGGTMDPSTPVARTAPMLATLPHAQRVILPGMGHGDGDACVSTIVSSFVEKPSVKVDTSCVKPVNTAFEVGK
jgi:hypothetical protein